MPSQPGGNGVDVLFRHDFLPGPGLARAFLRLNDDGVPVGEGEIPPGGSLRGGCRARSHREGHDEAWLCCSSSCQRYFPYELFHPQEAVSVRRG